MKQFILHPAKWNEYSFSTKLMLRLWALRHGSRISLSYHCPRKYIYLLDPEYMHTFEPRKSSTDSDYALTKEAFITSYGYITLNPDPMKGKITYLGDS